MRYAVFAGLFAVLPCCGGPASPTPTLSIDTPGTDSEDVPDVAVEPDAEDAEELADVEDIEDTADSSDPADPGDPETDGDNDTTDEPDTFSCPSGEPCQADLCTEEGVCDDDGCVPGEPISCDDGQPCTADGCDPDSGCIHQVAEGTCDDGDPCSDGDFCGGGACLPGAPLSCDDGRECTVDLCEPGAGCASVLDDGFCLIDGACYAAGDRLGLLGDDACQLCEPEVAADAWSPSQAGWLCGTEGKCAGLLYESQQICGDQTGACEGGGTIDCGGENPCTIFDCDPPIGCTAVPLLAGSKCGGEQCDGDLWHLEDTCLNGTCVDGGTLDCDEVDGDCQNGFCNEGCQVQNFAPTTPCKVGQSNACDGLLWHPTDLCDADGECVDSGVDVCPASTDCLASLCTPGVGCTTDATPEGASCGADTCVDPCSASPPSACDGDGACLPTDAPIACEGGHCLAGECTTACDANSDCCDDPEALICLAGQCTVQSDCSGPCDPNDLSDCEQGLACVDCDTQGCVGPAVGWHCYVKFTADGWDCK